MIDTLKQAVSVLVLLTVAAVVVAVGARAVFWLWP